MARKRNLEDNCYRSTGAAHSRPTPMASDRTGREGKLVFEHGKGQLQPCRVPIIKLCHPLSAAIELYRQH